MITPEYLPTATWPMLQRRAAIIKQVRSFFDERGFVEVETPLISSDSVVDLHIDPLPVILFSDARHPQDGRSMWLQSSPEFAMKRLLAAGADRIYQITKAFRGGETGANHNPEFTMLEWYRVGDSYQDGMNLLADFASSMLLNERIGRRSYASVFEEVIGINPHTDSLKALQECAARHLGTGSSSLGEDRDELLNLLLAECVEPQLGIQHPLILYDYPASQSALACTRQVDAVIPHSVAERFELYYQGRELANGYHELLDANVLRQRNTDNNARRVHDQRYPIPCDSRLLRAMEHGLPVCCGTAVGLDRLVMAITGSNSIAEVISFPIDRA